MFKEEAIVLNLNSVTLILFSVTIKRIIIVQSHNMEKEMATHFSIFAWKIPWTEEPGGLQSMGFQVRHSD